LTILRKKYVGELDAVLNRVIKVSFAIVGAITGFTLTRTFLSLQHIEMVPNIKIVLFCGMSLLAAFVFYSTGNKIIEGILKFLDKWESAILSMSLYELIVSAGGLIAGLIVANLVTIPIIKVDIVGVPLAIIANILFGCIGISIALGKKNEKLYESFGGRSGFFKSHKSTLQPKVLDTSVIIDGRIIDICRSGFLEGELVIPSFVLEELRHIADSSDTLKRNRGRRGLDVLNMIQKELGHPVKIESVEISEGAEVDSELLKMAERLGGKILTIDYNLNKVANLKGVPVLNVNELSNAVKPIALPGEEMVVQVIKDGKENGQGIGYLDDGTMIVVDGGRKHIGENVSVLVTSVLQTAAGRMIFAKPKYLVERAI
jgi:uncharacterized protein YacL